MMSNLLKICVVVFASIIYVGAIASDSDVWIDVRSEAEHKRDNIDGDILISHKGIVKGVTMLYPDKNTPIHLYCRSGHRAGIALSALKSAGYKNIRNAGSIEDARRERHEPK